MVHYGRWYLPAAEAPNNQPGPQAVTETRSVQPGSSNYIAGLRENRPKSRRQEKSSYEGTGN